MKNWSKKIFLKSLYLLIYFKRLFFGIIKLLGVFFNLIIRIFHNTAGPKIYRLLINWQKKTNLIKIPWYQKILELLGKRCTLQIIILILILIFALPQSKLYAKNSSLIPGQETLLYQIVGPGEDYAPLEDVTADYQQINQKKNTEDWKSGAISYQNKNTPTINQVEENNLSIEGTALVKPIILPGTTSTINASGQQLGAERTQSIVYIIKTGDTLNDIAKKFNLKTDTILWANNLTLKSRLKPGNGLKILPVDGLMYKIKRGDTIGRIAQIYKSNTQAIVQTNGLNNSGTNIQIGQDIIIPNGVKPVTQIAQPSKQYNPLREVTAPLPSIESPAGSGYVWPTSMRRVTQYFSWRHTGVDIAGPIGTPIYTTRAGEVIKSQCGWNGGYGCYIIIDHGNGIYSLYGHNSQLFVSVGDYVEQGQNISLMGSTGRSTGPHCHFEIRVNNARVNPLRYIR